MTLELDHEGLGHDKRRGEMATRILVFHGRARRASRVPAATATTAAATSATSAAALLRGHDTRTSLQHIKDANEG